MSVTKHRVIHSVQLAKRLGVRVYVDAEQTYLQPAIRHLVVHHLMPSFNREMPTFLNTVQCYLKVREPHSWGQAGEG